MIRQIIKINEELCNGCGLCAQACHEGAIGMVDGKAKLLRDDYCDGLGNCLPVCPTGAITFEQREAAAFDEEAVEAKMREQAVEKPQEKEEHHHGAHHAHGNHLHTHGDHAHSGGCPGSRAAALRGASSDARTGSPRTIPVSNNTPIPEKENTSELLQWPVQIKLLPIRAPYLDGAHLLIAADCAAYAHGKFHDTFMKDRITVIGCPKLDEGDYSEKLTEILRQNNIASVLVVRMEVPCCGGLSNAAITALKNCGKMIPWQVVTLSTRGEVL